MCRIFTVGSPFGERTSYWCGRWFKFTGRICTPSLLERIWFCLAERLIILDRGRPAQTRPTRRSAGRLRLKTARACTTRVTGPGTGIKMNPAPSLKDAPGSAATVHQTPHHLCRTQLRRSTAQHDILKAVRNSPVSREFASQPDHRRPARRQPASALQLRRPRAPDCQHRQQVRLHAAIRRTRRALSRLPSARLRRARLPFKPVRQTGARLGRGDSARSASAITASVFPYSPRST